MGSIRKWIAILVVFSITITTALGVTASAEENEKINIIIDGQEIVFDVEPIVIEGRTMVPFRKIFEVFGFQVNWTEATSTVFANKDTQVIVLQIDNKRAFVNNQQKQLDVPAMLINSRTMVPLRFISENIGATVEWIEASSTVKITSSKN